MVLRAVAGGGAEEGWAVVLEEEEEVLGNTSGSLEDVMVPVTCSTSRELCEALTV